MLDVCLILASGSPCIELEHLPPEFRRGLAGPAAAGGGASVATDGLGATLDVAGVEATAVRRVLGEINGNVSLAAKRLGVARSPSTA